MQISLLIDPDLLELLSCRHNGGFLKWLQIRKSQQLSCFIHSHSGALQRKPGLHSHGLCFPDKTVQILDLWSSQFWCLWALLGWTFFSWRSFHSSFGLADLSCLPDAIPGFCEAASAPCARCSADWKLKLLLHQHQGNWGLPGKPLLPRGVYDVGNRLVVTGNSRWLFWNYSSGDGSGSRRPQSCPGLCPRGWIPVTSVKKALWIQDWGDSRVVGAV